MATRKNRLQLLHGGLKRVQERGTRYKVADDLRISEPSLGDGACNVLGIFAPSLDSRASIKKELRGDGCEDSSDCPTFAPERGRG